MKTIISGDITTAESGIIVHCVNAQGAMSAGVALALLRKWPNVRSTYVKAYQDQGNKLHLGTISWVTVSSDDDNLLLVANLVGQEFYGGRPGVVYVDYDAIRAGFKIIAQVVKDNDPEMMIHYPQLGAGLAGGNWSIIEKIIDEELEDCNHTLWMFKP